MYPLRVVEIKHSQYKYGNSFLECRSSDILSWITTSPPLQTANLLLGPGRGSEEIKYPKPRRGPYKADLVLEPCVYKIYV